MKKNKTMRAASGLLIATLLSTSVVSGTYAKYVSKGSASDTARVAKWGVVITGSGNLFSENYLKDTNTPTTSTTDSEISVESSNDDMLVAPGTKSETGLAFGITGTPEVDTRVKATIIAKDVYLAAGNYAIMEKATVDATTFASMVTTGLYTKSDTAYTKVADSATFDSTETYYKIQTSTAATVASEGYYPVEFTYSGDSTAKTANAVAAAIADSLTTGTVTTTPSTTDGTTTYEISDIYDSNTDLGTALGTDAETLKWEWKYNNSIDTAWNNIDYEDTILGDLAAGTEVVTYTTDGKVTVLTVSDTTGVVKKGDTEVGCIRTTFDISIEAVQVD